MNRRERDPATMSPDERMAELGTILATGVRRLQMSRQIALAGDPDGERPCTSVDTPESSDDQEVA